MTQPIQEPTTERDVGGLGWRTGQLARRPMPPAAPSAEPAWIVGYDDFIWGQTIDAGGGITSLEFAYVDWSDNAGGIFSYEHATGNWAPDNYKLRLLVDGVYAFTAMEYCDDSIGNGTKDFKVAYQLNVSGHYPGTGIIPSTCRVEQWYTNTTKFSTSLIYLAHTWVLPIKVSSPFNVIPSLNITKEATDATSWGATFANYLSITYLGPMSYNQSLRTHNDPYPTTP